MFGLGCRSVSTTRWSVRSVSCVTRCWHRLWDLHIELGEQPALWVTLSWTLEAVFLGYQDISPSVDEKVLISLELLLLLLQASGSSY